MKEPYTWGRLKNSRAVACTFLYLAHTRLIQKLSRGLQSINVQKFCVTQILKDPLLKYIDQIKCDALRDLVPFVQFKNREKHPLLLLYYHY